MSKFAAAPFHRFCRKHGGWCCLAFSTLTLPASSVAAANTPDPALRRSDELDIRRLGRVSDTERSALRVAWRAAQTGEEEVRSVQDMLDSLRRMEATVGEIDRLVRGISAPAPLVTPVAPVAPVGPVAPVAVQRPEPADHGSRWALAAGALLVLLALWWFRRRDSGKPPGAAIAPSAEAAPDLAAAALEPFPATAAPVEPLPATAPPVEPAAATKPPPSMPVRGEPAGEAPAEAPPGEAYQSTVVLKTAPALPPLSASNQKPPAAPAVAEITPAAPPPATGIQAIDFSLEDAEPEAVARANARVPVPRTNTRPRVPERRQELHVEPTLQLAEIMLSMGLQQGAAKALVEYVEAHPREAVYHWLKLLGIYRDGGHRQDFEATATKLRKHFNIHAERSPCPGEAPTLESFPRVAQQVQSTWHRPDECIAYLQHLLKDNRDGERMGFPQSVAEEFLLLIEVLKGTSGATQSVGL